MYDFDELIDRRNSDSSKWNVRDNELSFSIADMDFKVAKPVIEAIKSKADFGIFGYSDVPLRYFQAYQKWWSKYHGFEMNTDWMIFSTGVVAAISSIVRKMTTVGENVLIQSPVYNIFYNSIINNGRNVISSDLVLENGEYKIDFDDLEKKLANPQTTLMILCNPHNPIGKIWNKETLSKIGKLCIKHHVLVLSDEIHCDIVAAGKSYVPFASVNEECANNSITCLSAGKSFNLAGIHAACIVIPNVHIRNKVNRALNTDEIAEPNVFAIDAVCSAFEHGRDWLNQCNEYINENRQFAKEKLTEQLSDYVSLIEADATYLLWIDSRKISTSTKILCDYLKNEYGLIVSSGISYGNNGDGFIRVNIACPKQVLDEGLRRMVEGIKKYIA